jgi:hypothetical protein
MFKHKNVQIQKNSNKKIKFERIQSLKIFSKQIGKKQKREGKKPAKRKKKPKEHREN